MANWCSNTVEFIGEHSQFEQLRELFEAMAGKEKKERKGQLPDFVKNEAGFLFETRWEDGILYYETKWSPNIQTMIKVADHFKVGFRHSYSEPGNMVFGEASYTEGRLIDIFLDDDDYRLYSFNEDTDTYTFENNNYESSDEILEILLERKKAISGLNQ
jgi:hypothetical protein